MTPAVIMAIIDGALAIVEKAMPYAKQLFNKGQVSLADQKALKDRIDALSGSEAFSGPEWEVAKD